MAYLNRTYRRLPGVPPGPMTGPVSWYGGFAGYDAYVFPHEAGHLSVVIVRPGTDRDLLTLRNAAAFDAVCAAIPGLAEWTSPRHANPTSGSGAAPGCSTSTGPSATCPGS
jgi:hypothetical protein